MTARARMFTLFALFSSFTLGRAQTPSISTITPSSVLAGSPGFTLTVTGTNFNPGAVLLWNNASVPVSIVSPTQLTASISASLIASSGSINIEVQNAAGIHSNIVAFTVAGAPISVAPGTLSAAVVGISYSQTFAASGGKIPYRWSVAGTLPGGLTFNPNTGVLSGTPETRGTFSFTVTVADSVGAVGIKTFSLVVNMPPLVITTGTPVFNGTVGLFYSQTFLASGGIPPLPLGYSCGQPPAGLTFDPNTGALTGTPSVAGTVNLTLQVTDMDAVKVSKAFQLTIDLPHLTILTPSPLPNGLTGSVYSQKFSASGGTVPYAWSLVGSVAGLSLDGSSGILSGTPSAPGSFNFAIQARDAAGATATKAFTLVISPSPLTITTSTSLPDSAIGLSYSQTDHRPGWSSALYVVREWPA